MLILCVFLAHFVFSSAYDNVAFNKPTKQEHPYGAYENLTKSSNAVDGLKSDLSYSGGQCVISKNEQTNATWWVNLTSILSIHHITIFYRTDNMAWNSSNPYTGRFLGFSLYVSNTTNKTDGKLCFKDTNFTNSTIPAVFNTTCSVLGQYVIYYNERLSGVTYPDDYSEFAFNELCEVEVYGQACSNGTYGLDCNKTCGHCRDEGSCHHVNGTCFSGCKPGYFGWLCNSPCGNCKNPGYCHHTNGTCLNGCEPGYHGEMCKTRNLAYKKPTYQESTHDSLTSQSSKAVDGLKSDLNYGQCAISANQQQTATWWVNLTSIFSISDITIYYRTGNAIWNSNNGYTKRFLGFSLYVSNTSNKADGKLCFKDTSYNRSTIPSVFKTTCLVHGQYVIYYNERLLGVSYPDGYSQHAFNELCEVEVFEGCSNPGYYGSGCSMPCPDPHCFYCQMETGICQGCKPGYEGHRCESECPDGNYGQGCRETCGHCNNLTQCHHVNGTCLDGCKPGYTGNFCNLTCGKGTFGKGCIDDCGHCLDDDSCYYVNGTCLTGCAPGYQGDLCKTDFGGGCQGICGHCSDPTQCHHVNGTCLGGCEPGYTGEYCNLTCEISTFGKGCIEDCGHCLDDDICYHVNGTCLTGCVPGYQGDLCKTECPNGTYGGGCRDICGHCSDTTQCHHINGTCLDGCAPGYTGEYCNLTCNHGNYGNKCNESCGHCLNDSYCYHTNGTCLTGCDPGYQGDQCNIPCESGTFGYDCKDHCGNCLNYSDCYHVNGTCSNGCDPGYEGHLCQTKCSPDYYGENCNSSCGECSNGDSCHHINGSCLHGCDLGYEGQLCTEVCVNGTYGAECNDTCGHCLDENQCYHTNGSCLTGCIPGYQAALCKKHCSDGYYGENCNRTCGNCSNGDSCHHINGSCLFGCDPGYKGQFCTEAIRDPMRGNEPISSSIGAVIGIFVALIIIVVVVFIVRRKGLQRHNHEKNDTAQGKQVQISFNNRVYNTVEIGQPSDKSGPSQGDYFSIPDDDENRESSSKGLATEQDDVYVNVVLPQGIPVNKLESIIAEKRADGNKGFKEEYATLPSGEKRSCDVGKKPENTSKNRYKTTFPYDHSRVILNVTEKEQFDYINANYIDGTNRTKEYIAAQGPKPNTLGDFWRMVWQEKVQTIVMVTNLKEGDKIKCTQYWPNINNARHLGSISVKLTDEKEYAFFIERKLSVTNTKLKQTRVVMQYHYISWPDHGTPEPMNLLDFHHHVMNSTNGSDVPTVVHCSAGVGRTGTFIALDALYQEGKKTGKVNVSEFVKRMRKNRVSMVQTNEQYITIFLALNEVFKAPINICSPTDFCTRTERTMKDNPANQNPLRKEFQHLLQVRHVYTETDYKMAIQAYEGRQTDKVLPLDRYSVHLSSSVPKRSNYINAIFVPSFKKARRFIVTQNPTPEDAVDFLRLLKDHESDTVICLDPMDDVESSWLPDSNSTKVVVPFTIHCQSTSSNDVIEHVIHILQEKHQDDPYSVFVVKPRRIINPLENPMDTTDILRLVSYVSHSKTDTPITVLSRDGASLCGVFIAVHNAVQQLEMDGVVDVFTTVRQLQVRRPELCGNIDEYSMINKALYDHIQNMEESIYSNQ